MDLKVFETELRKELSKLKYVISIDIKKRTPISLSGIIGLKKNYTLSVFYNQVYIVLSFSLICQNQRIWSLDKDNRIGWHIHPLDNTKNHIKINELAINEIIFELNKILDQLMTE